MSKPRLLDLCCKAGGCSYGFSLAGFEVHAVDLEPQPNYPFKFIQADALTFDLSGYDAYHASPPCQRYSLSSYFHSSQDNHPDLIVPIRERLAETGKPYVIENVEGAPVENPLMLCGLMFGLRTVRHRFFESNVLLLQPYHPEECPKCRKKLRGSRRRLRSAKPGAIAYGEELWSIGGHMGQRDRAQREGLGIDWMKTQAEIANAIPPSYTRYIGEQLLQYCEVQV